VAPWICRYLWAASLGMWYMPASKPAVWSSLPQLRCSSRRRSAVPVAKLGLHCLAYEAGERALVAENTLPALESELVRPKWWGTGWWVDTETHHLITTITRFMCTQLHSDSIRR
jgi:hypothetical protein